MSKENQNIEWKQSWQDDYMKWICGFANAQGGKIYIGRDDAGQVVGVGNAKELLETLPNKIRDRLGVMPHINLLQKDDKEYLEIIVAPSAAPISLHGSYYWRSGSVKQELRGSALNDFLLKKFGKTWDGMIEENTSLEDIDDTTIKRFHKDAAKAGRLPDLSNLSTTDILKKLRLLTRDGLTRAALVLFGKDPGEFYPNLFVKIGRFGTRDVDLRFHETCEGNLLQMMHDVMELLEKKFLIKPIHFEGLHRIEELEYPVDALREMLLNALVHRNYLGSMTQIKVYDNRLTFWNAGTLPKELTIEQILNTHESIPRNPLIAQVCYRAGYIESWGRGVEKISNACKKAQLLSPQFMERSGGILVELSKPLVRAHIDMLEESWGRVGEESGKSRERVGKTSQKILDLCSERSSITIPEMAQLIGITERSVERNIQKLRKNGLLLRAGGHKEGYWEVITKDFQDTKSKRVLYE